MLNITGLVYAQTITLMPTDHGRPIKSFSIFGRFISTYFGTLSPLSLISKKTKPLYLNPKYMYLRLGFDFKFGLQRVKDLAIVCL